MKYWLCLLFLMSGFVMPASAQEAYHWERYDLYITLPDGWVSHEMRDQLLLGTQADIGAVLVGDTATGLIVTIHPLATDAIPVHTLSHYSFIFDVGHETRTFGTTIRPVRRVNT